ncbi:MAG TPA: hypothetical protein GXZ52_04315 [Clostridiales bacterium]|nr:hypothetical protein [Clostridiales bacterium]
MLTYVAFKNTFESVILAMKGIMEENRKKSILAKINKCLSWLDKRPTLQLIFVANILNLVVEILSRRSVIKGVKYLLTTPLVFEYNALIILAANAPIRPRT